MKIKHLITSGCSLSDNVDMRWPHFLAAQLGVRLYNFGYGSSGNDHIVNSSIFQANKLLAEGIDPKDIGIIVMWSGMEREGHFISRGETTNFTELFNPGFVNPANFTTFEEVGPGRFVPKWADYSQLQSGWLLGSPHCSWQNDEITKLKQLHLENFYTFEHCVFKSLNYFLQLQWFCESKGIYLRNLCYKEILGNPFQFKTCTHLYNMLDMSKWIFWQFNLGLWEYTRDHQLPFYDDQFHPLPESHAHFVRNYLIGKL